MLRYVPPILQKVWHRAVKEIYWQSVLEAVIVLALVALFFFSTLVKRDMLWTSTGLVAISSLIAAQKTRLTFMGMLFHTIAVVLVFCFFSATIYYAPLFILACVILSVGIVFLQSYGENLRSLANFTFIPGLYLACQTFEYRHASHWGAFVHSLFYILLGSVCAIVVHTLYQYKFKPRSDNFFYYHKNLVNTNLFRLTHRDVELGEKVTYYKPLMIAIALSVGITASATNFFHLHHAQWAIWSAASIVTSNIEAAKNKLIHTFYGSIIGISLGTFLGFFIPHTNLFHDLCVLLVVVTLTAFRSYVVAFAARTTLIFLAAVAAGNSIHYSEERVVNIVFGGMIGCISVLLVFYLLNRFNKKAGSV